MRAVSTRSNLGANTRHAIKNQSPKSPDCNGTNPWPARFSITEQVFPACHRRVRGFPWLHPLWPLERELLPFPAAIFSSTDEREAGALLPSKRCLPLDQRPFCGPPKLGFCSDRRIGRSFGCPEARGRPKWLFPSVCAATSAFGPALILATGCMWVGGSVCRQVPGHAFKRKTPPGWAGFDNEVSA